MEYKYNNSHINIRILNYSIRDINIWLHNYLTYSKLFLCEQILKGLMVNINVTMHPIQIYKYHIINIIVYINIYCIIINPYYILYNLYIIKHYKLPVWIANIVGIN